MRNPTPSFIAEFPLRMSAADERALVVRFEAARHIYNDTLCKALRRLTLMRETREWQAALVMPKGVASTAARHARATAFNTAIIRFRFTSGVLQKGAEGCQDTCWIREHLVDSHDTQTTSLRAFRAVQQYAFGRRGRPRFKGQGRLNSVEGKDDAAPAPPGKQDACGFVVGFGPAVPA